jgi:hypothetical protein
METKAKELPFPDRLSAAFKKWKSTETGAEGAYELDRAIDFAKFNGINLILKVPESALNENAIGFGTRVEGGLVLFYIPSRLGRSGEGSDKIPDIVEQTDYKHVSHLLIRTLKMGVCATLSPGQVAALEIK